MSLTGATWKNRVAWLGELQKAQPQAIASAFDLAVEIGVAKANWEEIKAATITYIQASLGSSDNVSSDDAVDALTSLLEPLIMAVLGVLIGGLVIAMYLPIFKMGQVI